MQSIRFTRRQLKVLFAATTCALIVAFACIGEPRAYGYTDPGSGLLILQSVGSAVMGVVFVCRRKISQLLRRGSAEETPQPEAPISSHDGNQG